MKRIACTAVNGRILFGNVNKSGTDFTGTTQDVTSDCLKAVIDKVGTERPHVITSDGRPVYEITIKMMGEQR